MTERSCAICHHLFDGGDEVATDWRYVCAACGMDEAGARNPDDELAL